MSAFVTQISISLLVVEFCPFLLSILLDAIEFDELMIIAIGDASFFTVYSFSFEEA